MSGVYNKFLNLKAGGFEPIKILDIGANVGEFTNSCKQIWPNCEYFLVEANRNCEKYLSQISSKCFIEVLGEFENKEINFFMTNENETGTGNSVYIEKTNHYAEEKLIIDKRNTKKLDILFENESFDLIKIDTQGSELDILRGGVEIAKKAKYILIETSVKEYNENAPLENEVIEYMNSIGYDKYIPLEEHIWPVEEGLFTKGEVFQRDLIFYKSEL